MRGNLKNGCSGYAVYADFAQSWDIGLNKGVHTWSIKKCYQHSSCFASIGVTTEKNDKLINEWHHASNRINGQVIDWIDSAKTGCNSNYQGCPDWGQQGIIITVILNCNDWTVTYYKKDRNFAICTAKDKIEPNKCYFFTMLCCAASYHTDCKVMEN